MNRGEINLFLDGCRSYLLGKWHWTDVGWWLTSETCWNSNELPMSIVENFRRRIKAEFLWDNWGLVEEVEALSISHSEELQEQNLKYHETGKHHPFGLCKHYREGRLEGGFLLPRMRERPRHSAVEASRTSANRCPVYGIVGSLRNRVWSMIRSAPEHILRSIDQLSANYRSALGRETYVDLTIGQAQSQLVTQQLSFKPQRRNFSQPCIYLTLRI